MELLKTLTQTYSPSGDEEGIMQVIKQTLTPYADEIFNDNLGNLVVHKKGDGKKILLAAHMDEIGLLVNYIDENGFLRFSPIGGINVHCALYQRVTFKNGTKGIVAYEEKTDVKKELDPTKMYIDIGSASFDEATERVSIGDSAVFDGEFSVNGEFVFSKAMDNRIGVYVLMRVAMELGASSNDLYFVFTTQEELGCRGAKAVSHLINPDIALAVDVTDTGDTPRCNRMAVKLGKGPCIKYMDKSIITHKKVNEVLKNCAEQEGIDVQHEVLSFGGTDAGAIHTSGTGVMTGAVSIPTRYIHTPGECIHWSDVENSVRLISKFIQTEFV